MREFELYGTVRAVVCFCDSLNYLLEEEELAQCFRLVNNYLDPGGLFIFDFNTVYKYETVIGDARLLKTGITAALSGKTSMTVRIRSMNMI